MGFLKSRAPFYLAGAALVAVLVVPELTKSDLADTFPELDAERQGALDMLMGYSGPDGDGLTVMEALTNRIADEYPGERIYEHRRTSVGLDVEPEGDGHRITLDFESYRGMLAYDWSVDQSGGITSNNQAARHIINVVDFYD